MSEADKMFENLGYEKKDTYWKEDEQIHFIEYSTDEISIEFSIFTKHIMITNLINIQELQAINKKCEELGWIEE